MRAFLTLLRTDGSRATGKDVCDLFFADRWFLDLIARRARQAVDTGAVPKEGREDLEQEIALLFVQKARKRPDLRIRYDVVEVHFGGWIWKIIKRLCIEAIRQRHGHFHPEAGLPGDVAGATGQDPDTNADVVLLVAGLPQLTQTILAFFNEGYTLKEIAVLVGEKYWKVCDIYRRAIAFLKERLDD